MEKILKWKEFILIAVSAIWFSFTYLYEANQAIKAIPRIQQELDSIKVKAPRDGVFVTKKQFYKAMMTAYRMRAADSVRAVHIENRVEDHEEILEEMTRQFNIIYQHLRD